MMKNNIVIGIVVHEYDTANILRDMTNKGNITKIETCWIYVLPRRDQIVVVISFSTQCQRLLWISLF